MTNKILILAGKKSEQIAEVFRRQGNDVSPYSDIEPDYAKVLEDYDNQHYDIAVIFDATMMNKTVAENGILYFLSNFRTMGNKLRIIFVADKDRSIHDPFITRLINKGVHDLVVPEAMGDEKNKQIAAVLQMIEFPRNYSHVKHYKKRGVVDLDYDKLAHKKVMERSKKLQGSGSLPKAHIQIGVIGASRFSGTSHTAQIIARSLFLAGIETALVISREEDYTNIRDFFYRADLISPSRINIAGIDVYHGSTIAETDREQKATVFDFQTINLQVVPKRIQQKPEYAISHELTQAWLKCDCKVLCSGTAPHRLAYLEDVLRSLSNAQLKQLNIALNLSSEQMLNYITASISNEAPDCNVFSVHEMPDPLASTEIPDFVKSIMANDYDYTLKRVD